MLIFVTASNGLYRSVCEYCAFCAKRYGRFDKVVVYDVDTMIDESYRQRHAEILSAKRGAGLWLWKVYFIEKAIREVCQDGDILFYADAASFFFRDVKPVIQKMQGDVFACNVPYIEEEFTKRETIELMGLKEDRFTKTRQFHASFMAFKKSSFSVGFIEEWKNCCEDVRLISSDSYVDQQIPNYIAHRNDQSIFSLLCKKYGIIPSEDPSQYGITGYADCKEATVQPLCPTTSYPFCIMLHKQRNWGQFEKIKCWLRIYKRYAIIIKRNLRRTKI